MARSTASLRSSDIVTSAAPARSCGRPTCLALVRRECQVYGAAQRAAGRHDRGVRAAGGCSWMPVSDEAGPASAVDALLAEARAGLDRVEPGDLPAVIAAGGLVVDTRPADQRTRDGAVRGAVVVDRNVLE